MIDQFNQFKVLMYSDRIRKIVREEIPAPVMVEVDPSNYCNDKCIWCFYDDYRKDNKAMLSERVMDDLLIELNGIGVKAVTFTGGGEPLTNPDLMNIINNNIGKLEIGLVTNGGLMTDYQTIAEGCRTLRVSLDAACKETYKELHGVDDFVKVIDNVCGVVNFKNQHNTDLEVGLTYLVHDRNVNELKDFVGLARSVGVNYVYIRPVLNSELSNDSIKQAVDTLNSLGVYKNFKVFSNIARFNEVSTGQKPFKKCLATPLIAEVGATGDVYLCCQLRGFKQFTLGNINNNSFTNVWYSDKHKQIIKSIDVSKCVPCRNSFYNQLIEQSFIDDKLQRCFL